MSASGTPPVAVLDTSVLYPAWSRVLLQRLAGGDPPRFRGVWSGEIVRELWRTLTAQSMARGRSPEAARNQVRGMLYPLHQALVLVDGAGRSPATPPSPLRDPGDEHLWNAAVNAGAHYVVSHNTRDFPPPTLVTARAADEMVQAARHLYQNVEFLTAIEFIEGVLDEDAAVLYGRPLPAGVVRGRRAP